MGAALLWFGTVGRAVYHIIIQLPLSAALEVLHVVARRKRSGSVDGLTLCTDPDTAISDADVSIVIEAMGGLVPAASLVERALTYGKHVMTTNKELVAEHGQALETLPARRQKALLFEAAIGGSVPVVTTLRDYLKGCQLVSARSAPNVTSSFVLDQMRSGLAKKRR